MPHFDRFSARQAYQEPQIVNYDINGAPVLDLEKVDDFLTTALLAGANVTITHDEALNTFTIAVTGLVGVTDGDKGDVVVTGSGTVWSFDSGVVSAFARTFLDDANAAAVQATLGLVIGTNVQAFNTNLAAIAGLTTANDRLTYWTGSGSAALATFTAFGRSLVDDVDAAAARSTLALGTAATESTSTSGHNLGFLDGANVHSGLNGFTNAIYVSGNSTPASGSNVEIRYTGASGLIIAYNRTGSAYLPMVIGGSTFAVEISGVSTFTVGATVASAVDIAVAVGKVITNNSLQVLGARKTGWSVDTGTAKRTANATYSATANAAYTQAQIQALMDAVRDATQTIKALKDDLHNTAGHGLIGT